MTFKIVLEFETEEDVENWLAGYLDGGGEQTLGYCADLAKSGRQKAPDYHLLLKGYRQCPECRFGDIGTMKEYLEHYQILMEIDPHHHAIKDKAKTHKCQNCYCECNEEDIVNA